METLRQEKLIADERYIRPASADKKMKAAKDMRQTVYIYGVSGYGKTSLAVDFLSRRRYEYYSMSNSDLGQVTLPKAGKREKERIVVVDDLHLLFSHEDREQAYPVLKKLADHPDIWLILISRCPLPLWLKPIEASQIFAVIGEKELSFNEEEEAIYLEKWNCRVLTDTKKHLRELSQGMALFIRYSVVRLLELSSEEKESQGRLNAELSALETARRDWWGYLEFHVFSQWNIELQEFFMDMSVVDSFDLQLAQFITKNNDAGRLIAMARETGNFLIETIAGDETVYVIRESLRLSLNTILKKRCTKTYIDRLYYNAGSSFELENKVVEALKMYEKCRDEGAISRLLTVNARKYAGLGHYWELRRYYFALSEEAICENPELMAAMAMLNSILLRDEESERWYEALYRYGEKQSGSARKAAQAKLLYLDISLPHRGTVQMVSLLKKVGVLMAERKNVLQEVSLTNNHPSIMNGGKDFCSWSKQDRQMAASIGKIAELVLGRFGKGLVKLALAESFFEKGEDNYEVATLANQGRIQAGSGGKPEMEFVAVGILARLSVMNNNMGDALESLESFRRRAAYDAPQLLSCIDALKIRILLNGGRTEDVSRWLQGAPDEEAEFCSLERYSYIIKVRVYLALGKKEKAFSLLERLLYYAQKRDRIYLQIEAKVLLAIVKYRMGESGWKDTIQNALTQAESYHFVRLLSCEGAALQPLLKEGDFKWEDEGFRRQVMTECSQQALLYPAYLTEKSAGQVTLGEKALMILRMQSEGLSTEEIAGRMGISVAGVKYYNRETYRKLGVSSKAAAVIEAGKRKLL